MRAREQAAYCFSDKQARTYLVFAALVVALDLVRLALCDRGLLEPPARLHSLGLELGTRLDVDLLKLDALLCGWAKVPSERVRRVWICARICAGERGVGVRAHLSG